MTDYLSAELTATCAAIGYFDGTDYHLDKNCLDVIKDLIRYLKRDDDTHTIRRFLGQTGLLKTDLVKILIHHVKNTELWDVLLRLLINLTSSAFVIYDEQIPTDKITYSFYQQLVVYLQEYKAALTDENVWLAIAGRLGNLLNVDSTERGEEDELTIERILVFIRNVLQVPPNDNDKRADNDATVHDEILFALHASGIVDILLFIVSNKQEQQYHIQILEIISLMLREQNASLLAASGLQRSTAERENDEAKLVELRQKELREKRDKVRKYAGSRHSRFGGTYVVQNMKATGENQMICHEPYKKIEALEFGYNKNRVKRRKDKLGLRDVKEERTSALSVRLFLKEFCVEFLSAAYNPVMRFARSCIMSDTHSQALETAVYLWVLRFFMEFNRHYKFQVKYVSETISTEVFYLVQRQMEQYYEMIITDKKRIPLWSRRLHLALKAYQELLNTLMAMDKSKDNGVRESCKIIKSNIFYVPEYRETIFSQLLCFDEVKMSRQYLRDLITTAHIFLKMLEHFCQKGQRHLIVCKIKPKRRKAKKGKTESTKENVTTAPTLEERWDIIGPELSAVMRDAVIPVVVPFDATLDTPIDDQKADAMKRIQKLMRQRNLEQALGLLRAAREIWPENDCFGKADMLPEEEFLALREIFFADLGVTSRYAPRVRLPSVIRLSLATECQCNKERLRSHELRSIKHAKEEPFLKFKALVRTESSSRTKLKSFLQKNSIFFFILITYFVVYRKALLIHVCLRVETVLLPYIKYMFHRLAQSTKYENRERRKMVELKSLGETSEEQRRNLYATVVRTILPLRKYKSTCSRLKNIKDIINVKKKYHMRYVNGPGWRPVRDRALDESWARCHDEWDTGVRFRPRTDEYKHAAKENDLVQKRNTASHIIYIKILDSSSAEDELFIKYYLLIISINYDLCHFSSVNSCAKLYCWNSIDD
ncbi:hypothetical protein P5V15_001919, partial [Pogonomyrmex californicus]